MLSKSFQTFWLLMSKHKECYLKYSTWPFADLIVHYKTKVWSVFVLLAHPMANHTSHSQKCSQILFERQKKSHCEIDIFVHDTAP